MVQLGDKAVSKPPPPLPWTENGLFNAPDISIPQQIKLLLNSTPGIGDLSQSQRNSIMGNPDAPSAQRVTLFAAERLRKMEQASRRVARTAALNTPISETPPAA